MTRLRAWPPPPWETAAAATLVLAVAIAVAPITGSVPVALLSIVWFAAVAVLAVRVVVGGWRRFTAAHWVGVAGVGIAALRMGSLGLVRLVDGRPALFWSVDWRYHATQAHGIARFGNLSDSLDYAGRPVVYHVGPAWIAGGLNRLLGVPIDLVLFLVVPVVTVTVVGYAAYRFLRCVGAGRRAALLAVAVAVNLPTNPVGIVRHLGSAHALDTAFNADNWWFAQSLMLNSLLAIAVGFTAAWAILAARSHLVAALGAIGFATVVALKPQYLVGFLAVLAVGVVVSAWRSPARMGRRRLAVVAGALVVSFLVFRSITKQTSSFTGLRIDLSPLWDSHEAEANALLFAAIATVLVLVFVPRTRRRVAPLLRRYAVGAAVGALALVLFLDSTTFLLDAHLVAQAQAVGLDYVRASYDSDLQQSLVPATLVVVMFALACGFGVLWWSSRGVRVTAVVGACVLIALSLPITASAILAPTGRAAYEWTEERDLAELFDRVDVDRGRWISSDLADPAHDFDRPLRAINLTSLSDAQFYVANVAYDGWTQKDVVQRMHDLRRFYDTDWSPWHERFLRRHGIRFVLVRDRCPARWDASEFPGHIVGSRGGWTLLEVGGTPAASTSGERLWPAFTGEPRFGQSACLTGKLVS